MTKNIYFDCDGTWIDLYGVNNWLADLINENVRPYVEAKPMINLSSFAKIIHKLQNNGWNVGIISWTSKNGSEEYNKAVKEAKMNWLKKHLPSVNFDEIHIINYGTPKWSCGNGILFDDEMNNRVEWEKHKAGKAFSQEKIIENLKALL